jgi:hypothetical protein
MEVPAGNALVSVHTTEYGLSTGIESEQVEVLAHNDKAFDGHGNGPLPSPDADC